MKIHITTIPHEDQRYNTCGDYGLSTNGDWWITISTMDDWRYVILVAIHELVEMAWVVYTKVDIDAIDAFDQQFETDRENGKHAPEEEPGDDPKAPYHQGHVHATFIEKLFAVILGVRWRQYEEDIWNL